MGNSSSSWRNSESAFRFCPCDALKTTITKSVWLKLEKLLEARGTVSVVLNPCKSNTMFFVSELMIQVYIPETLHHSSIG